MVPDGAGLPDRQDGLQGARRDRASGTTTTTRLSRWVPTQPPTSGRSGGSSQYVTPSSQRPNLSMSNLSASPALTNGRTCSLEAHTAHEAPALTPRTGSRLLLAGRSDERLVEMVRQGDAAAFEVLYDRYHLRILSFCRHMLGSQQDGEDATQHAFVALHGHITGDDGLSTSSPGSSRSRATAACPSSAHAATTPTSTTPSSSPRRRDLPTASSAAATCASCSAIFRSFPTISARRCCSRASATSAAIRSPQSSAAGRRRSRRSSSRPGPRS